MGCDSYIIIIGHNKYQLSTIICNKMLNSFLEYPNYTEQVIIQEDMKLKI